MKKVVEAGEFELQVGTASDQIKLVKTIVSDRRKGKIVLS
jgi:hypothetical protein